MKVISIVTIIALVVLAVGIGLLFTQQGTALDTTDDKIVVATTIAPLADIARNIGQHQIRVIQLLPPGASPHSYTPTPQQLADAQDAQVLFVIGHGLDDRTARALARISDIPTVTTDKNIKLRQFEDASTDANQDDDHQAGSVDPHYWLTAPNGQAIATTIAQTLEQIDPTNGTQYQQNLEQYVTQLAALETELKAQAQQAGHPEFFAIHDAWSYVADHYGLNLVATYEPVEGRQPSIADIRNLQQTVQQYDIKTFFTEPQKQSTSTTRFLAEELGLEIKVIDPIGGSDNRTTYIDLMRENMKQLTQ